MRNRFTLPLLALGLTLLAAAPAAAQSVNDFQLPPNPSPTPTPRAQGPVDDSGVVPVAPRPIPTAAPTRGPTPTPSPTQSPTARPTATPAGTPVPRSSATRPATGSVAAPAATPGLPLPAPDETPLASPSPEFTLPSPAQSPSPLPSSQPTGEDFALPDWWWMAAGGAALLALMAGLLFWRRRTAAKTVPEIIRPEVGSAQALADGDLLRYLKVEVDAVRLTRSMMAATLTYRVTLSNRAPEAIRNITLDGDLTSAHGQAPIGEQLADALTALPSLHGLEHLGAGQSKSFTGEVRLELKHVRPIRQGTVPIYVPLVRLKASASGAEARAFTFVVGKASNVAGTRLQPFRLDTPPQTYHEIGARPLV